MRASEHFYSELDAAARRNRGSPTAAVEGASLAFSRLVAPIAGEDVANELFNWWLERYGTGEAPHWEKLAHISAFVLGDYDAATMDLDATDWEAIRDVLSGAADELDLDVLSRLMMDLVSRGALD
jgi:hypothetical protein